MSPGWKLLTHPALDGALNMAVDWWLLTRVERPVLRFYRWASPTLSLGYRQQGTPPEDLSEPVKSLPRVVRPTGGGYLIHADEITYSLVLPSTHPLARRSIERSYDVVRDLFETALVEGGLLSDPERGTDRSDPEECLEGAAAHESIQQGRKWMASAQVRRRGAVLQHGSLFWSPRGWPGDPKLSRPYFLARSRGADRRTVRNRLIRAVAGSLFGGRRGEAGRLSDADWRRCRRQSRRFRVTSWDQLPVFRRGN